jgi:hypothetical protein
MENTCLFFGEFFFRNGEKMFQTDGSIQISEQENFGMLNKTTTEFCSKVLLLRRTFCII